MFEDIRSDHRREGLSIRQLAEKYHVHRRTVRDALADPRPPERKEYPQRGRPVLGPWVETIDGWLEADLKAPPKQRHTATRIHARLVAEHGVEVSVRAVSKYVAVRRAEIGNCQQEVFVEQDHLPGAEAEVDFGDIHAEVDGVLTKFAIFEMRLSSSGKQFHVAFNTTGSEAFLEGHVLAFDHFGGVPGRIRYDNLKPAVTRVLKGRDRIQNERFILLRSHYGFESFFCRPGRDGAHEKGGVEGGIGYFRRNYLVPVPKVSSLGELNAIIAAGDLAEEGRVIAGRSQTIGDAAAAERGFLQPLPAERFDSAMVLSPKVDKHSRVSVRQSFYSVPVRFVGKRVHVRLTATQVEVVDGSKVVAIHDRAFTRNSHVLELDHYLEVLVKKPGALPGSTMLARAKAAGTFTASHQRYWDALRAAHGDQAGTRFFIEVLLAHRCRGVEELICAMDVAVDSGALSPQSVIMDARHLATESLAPVIALESIARYDRPAPGLAHYDDLLPLRNAQ